MQEANPATARSRARECDARKIRRIRARSRCRSRNLFAAVLALGVAACALRANAEPPAPAAAGTAPATAQSENPETAAIAAAAADIAARSRDLAARGGAAYQRDALERVRRSCASRQVVRLDEMEPAAVRTDARPTPSPPLFELDLDAAGTVLEPIEGTIYEKQPDGIALARGELRTSAKLEIVRDRIGTIEIDAVTKGRGHFLVGWSDAPNARRIRRKSARIELIGDGRPHTYAIDAAAALARGLSPGQAVRRWFLATRADQPVVIRAMRVLPRIARLEAPWGTSYESRGDELRRVLYMRTPTTLEYDATVPADAPVLETGLSALAGDGKIDIAIAIDDAGTRTTLVERTIEDGPWADVDVDLSRWAGRRVRIVLSARGSSGAAALWSSPLVRARKAGAAAEPFLLIVEDALRADRLSLYGGPVAAPSHSRLAAWGVVFDRAFAQATHTRSSVASMMTSLLPSATGVWDFSDALSGRYVTLAEAMRACGFATASFVQNGNAGAYAGLAQGFDVVFDQTMGEATAAELVRPGAPLDRWITRQRGRPYFAYVHILDPHGPYDPRPRPDLGDLSGASPVRRDPSLDARWLAAPTAEARRRLYDAEIASNDNALVTLLDRIETLGDLERATIAVVADHGEFLGEHGGMWRHHAPAHFEVARVPFVLRAPGAVRRRIQEPVALLDVAPTLLDLAHIDASGLAMHGRSLAGVVAGGDVARGAVPADEMTYADGERQPSGCGSFATARSLWIRSCTRDEDFSPARLLPNRRGGDKTVRRVSLAPGDTGVEPAPSSTDAGSRVAAADGLTEMQRESVNAWSRMTEGEREPVVSEPASTERLKALGYAQ